LVSKLLNRVFKEHKSEERCLYDHVAEEYAADDAQAAPILKGLVAKLIAEERCSYILDLGCGAGRYFPVLKGDLIVGVDLSVGMLKQALRKFKSVNLIQSDVFHLPFRKGVFDLVISMSIIGEHCPFNVELLEEIRRTLSQDGVFAFTSVPLHHYLTRLPLIMYMLLRGRSVYSIFYASKHRIKTSLWRLGFKIDCIQEIHSKPSTVQAHHYVVAIKQSADA